MLYPIRNKHKSTISRHYLGQMSNIPMTFFGYPHKHKIQTTIPGE